MRRRAAESVPSDWEHSKLAIQETGGWIKNADTKSTILAGSFGLSLTFAVPRLLEAIPNIVTVPFAFGLWVSSGVIFIAAALLTGYRIGNALLPRTSLGANLTNRFAWSSLAGMTPEHLPPRQMSGEDIRAEAWDQAASLARIAAAKYSSLQIALIAFCVYLAALLAMLIIQTAAAALA
ncbi:hypothetical protein SAMN06295909_0092 [Plantibacter sp. VKM Ac-1784]|uniref:Pycsar effector protein domain-containing protein n=1 Tax=Plantibacter elymi (nom. nud.) TaxID=199708 RepID=A0ABY1R727_9MICO|nr:Pycsar system effector family protein [Plantibacter sp. VKM Ac-1784]SMQ58028.1 hypothetical protein SAMN06295909_0092 [Plantibacter sp. VKM Ac-1784]